MPFPFTNQKNYSSVKEMINHSGLKQRFLAKQLGISETMLSHQLAGRRKMNYDNIKQLAKLLRVRVRDLKSFMLK